MVLKFDMYCLKKIFILFFIGLKTPSNNLLLKTPTTNFSLENNSSFLQRKDSIVSTDGSKHMRNKRLSLSIFGSFVDDDSDGSFVDDDSDKCTLDFQNNGLILCSFPVKD